MKKIIRHTAGMKKEIGAALLGALQMISLILIGLMAPLVTGPHQSASAPGGSQTSATQTRTNEAVTGTGKDNLRASAIAATKLSEPYATAVFSLATSRAESAQQSGHQSGQQSSQQSESPN